MQREPTRTVGSVMCGIVTFGCYTGGVILVGDRFGRSKVSVTRRKCNEASV